MAVAAGALVGEQHFQEVVVGQVFGAGQGEPFGQGVEQLAEFQAPQQRLELGGDLDGLGRGGAGGAMGGAHEGLRTVKSLLSRTNRLALLTTGAGGAAG